jgi:hypothetical protein
VSSLISQRPNSTSCSSFAQTHHYNHHYSHRSNDRSAELSFHESDRLWVISIKSDLDQRIHGFYPSLASAQLILNALGFMPS